MASIEKIAYTHLLYGYTTYKFIQLYPINLVNFSLYHIELLILKTGNYSREYPLHKSVSGCPLHTQM